MSTVDILLVEDNPGDVHLIERAFSRAAPLTLHVVRRGDEAIEWLHRRGKFVDAPRPQLVLLDLNLPIVDGFGVLEEMKTDAALKRLPVIVLTGSDSQRDIDAAYAAHANACLVKPADPDELASIVRAFEGFWLSAAALPNHPAGNDNSRR